MMPILYLVMLIVIASSVFFLANSLFQFRLRPRLRTMEDTSSQKRQLSISSLKFLKPFISFTKPIANLPYLRTLQTQAEILKIKFDMPGLVLIKVLLAIAAGVIVFMLLADPNYALIAAAMGFLIPDFILFSKIKGKKEEIIRVFPETVDLIDLCVGAGLDFTSSIQWVIDKTETNPFIEQMGIVLNEIRLGRNRSEALKDMAKRLQIPDISSFVRTVIQSERMGTSVAEAFRNLSEDTRNSRFQTGERYAIKASLKILFPLLFCILPVILIVVAGPIIIKFTQGELFPQTF